MADNEILVDLTLDTANFTQNVQESSSLVDRLTEKIRNAGETSTEAASHASEIKEAFAETAIKVAEFLAVVELAKKSIELMTESIKAAAVNDDAFQALADSMSRVGEFTNTAFENMKAFTDELSQSTGITTTAAAQALSLAESYGLTGDKAKEIVETATNMSAALGISVNEAVIKLNATMNGHLGRLAALNPALKDLTADELAAGDAVKLLADQFDGAAQGALSTYNGQVKLLSNAFEEFQVALGKLVTQSAPIRLIIQDLREVFETLATTVSANQETIQRFIASSLLNLLDTVRQLIPVFSALFDAFNPFKSDDPFSSLKAGADTFKEALDDVKIVITDIAAAILNLKVNMLEIKLGALEAKKSAEELFSGPKASPVGVGLPGRPADTDTTGQAIYETNSKIAQAIQAIKDLAYRTTEIATPNGPKSAAEVDQNGDPTLGIGATAPKVNGLLGKLDGTLGEMTEQLRKMLTGETSLTIKPGDTTQNRYTSPSSPDYGQETTDNPNASLVPGAIQQTSTILGGASGAAAFVTTLGQGIVDAFAPGFGQAIGPFLNAFEKGPEYVRQQVEAFAKALPALLDNVAKSIPVFIKALADNVGPIIEALAKASPAIAIAIAKALNDPQTYLALVDGILQAVKDGFGENGRQFNQAMHIALDEVTKAFDKVATAGTDLYNSIVDAGRQFVKNVTPGGGSSGGPGDAISGAYHSVIGHADGGYAVQGSSGKDSVLSYLDPGELVIDKSTGPRLNAFLDQYQGGGNNDAMVNVLSQILAAVQSPINVTSTAQVNGKAFADVMLQLNRSRARVTA